MRRDLKVIPDRDVDWGRPSTWVQFRQRLCRDCTADCCRLPVEITIADLIRIGVIDEFEALESPKKIAKRLKKEGLIDHFHCKYTIFTLAQMANGECIYLDSRTRRCTIYENRPETCRNHPQVGPRPGYCAYTKKTI